MWNPPLYTHSPYVGSFVPYSYYNQDLDKVSVYFKDEDCYVQTVNEDMELHISFDSKEVVGLNFLNVKQLTNKLAQ
jgi:hypothetical protein